MSLSKHLRPSNTTQEKKEEKIKVNKIKKKKDTDYVKLLHVWLYRNFIVRKQNKPRPQKPLPHYSRFQVTPHKYFGFVYATWRT